MKRVLSSITAGLIVFGCAAPVAFASTASTASTSFKIVVNNDSLSAPHSISKNGTTYIPVWYVIQALKTQGIHSKWNGHQWSVTTETQVASSGSAKAVGNHQASVFVNGKWIMNIPSIVATDSASSRLTTYLSVQGVQQVLSHLNIHYVWKGNEWSLETANVQKLQQAFTNTEGAPTSQIVSTLTEDIQNHLTKQGKTDLKGKPNHIDITMNMNEEKGTVNGQKSMLLSITPTSSSIKSGKSTTTMPKMQEYMQGNRMWMNEGSGWTELKNSEQLLKQFRSQFSASNVNFAGLRNIQSSNDGKTTTYTATLNGKALEKVFSSAMGNLNSSLPGKPGASTAAMSKFFNTLFTNMKGTLHIKVAPINGHNRIVNEQMTMDLNLPMNSLPVPKGTSKKPTSDMSSMSIHETMNSTYAYQSISVKPPAGLNTAGATNATN